MRRSRKERDREEEGRERLQGKRIKEPGKNRGREAREKEKGSGDRKGKRKAGKREKERERGTKAISLRWKRMSELYSSCLCLQ